MTENLEALKTNVWFEKKSSSENVIDYTNAVIWDVFDGEERLSLSYLIEQVKELNPNVKIKTDVLKSVIFSSVDIEDLVLPQWFYCCKWKITNKYNVQDGDYCILHVYPLSYYNPDMF